MVLSFVIGKSDFFVFYDSRLNLSTLTHLNRHCRSTSTFIAGLSQLTHPSPQTEHTVVDLLCSPFSLTGGGGGGGGGSEKAAALEQKLYKLQEELTELHRQKGEVHQID